MKTVLFCLLAAVVGAAGAWKINYDRYAHRKGKLGPIGMSGDINAKNVSRFVNIGIGADDANREGKELGKVEVAGDSTHDFGVMAPGEEGEHTFVIRNVGKGTLKLRVGATTCKCTLGELGNDELEPGSETKINLTWRVKTAEPEFGQSAQVLTDDPSQPAITFQIKGKVVQDLEFVPKEWTFGQVATGETIEFSGRIFNFMKSEIEPVRSLFTSDEMNNLSEIDVQPIDPADGGPGREKAIQAFEVKVKIDPGMKQGEVFQRLNFGFQLVKNAEALKKYEGDEDTTLYAHIPIKGRISGTLGMITSSKLTYDGSDYIYDFGKLGPEDPLIGKAFVVLKGKERDNTTLTIGKLTPDGVVKATLGEPKGRGSMSLYPLEIELVPGSKAIARLGKDSGDYGSIWIESDNPKVPKMRVVLKFAIEGR